MISIHGNGLIATATPEFDNPVKAKNLPKVWAVWDGTGGQNPPQSSYNVSSITHTGTGTYQINFITPMVDTLYCTNWTMNWSAGGGGYLCVPKYTFRYLGYCVIQTGQVANSIAPYDCPQLSFVVYGN